MTDTPDLFESQQPLPTSGIPDEHRLFTYEEVAAACLVSKQTVYEWVRGGRVESPTYFGPNARFSLAQVLRMKRGIDPVGTFTVAESPRAKAALAVVGKLQENARARQLAQEQARRDAERIEREKSEAALLAIAEADKPRWVKELELDEKPAPKKPAPKKPAPKPATAKKPAPKKPAPKPATAKKPAPKKPAPKKPAPKKKP